ncbi:MAG TPA: ATP-binding protein [Ilumatobacter sp.]|nr:ATP-binding protein [Ilumatobacter sp.]
MRTTQVGSAAAAQLAFAGAVLASDVNGPAALAVGLHLLLGSLGVAVLVGRAHSAFFVAGLHALLGYDFAVSSTTAEPLVALAFAFAALTLAMPILVFHGRWPVVWCGLSTIGICICIEVAHPEWSPRLLIAVASTSPAMCVVALSIIHALRRFASRADRAHADAELEAEQVVRARAAHDAATEDARVLHDTVVNTLGALAADGAQRHSATLVRAMCQADIARVELLMSTGTDRGGAAGLFDFGPGLVDVHRSGLAGDELRRYAALLPSEVAMALQGCVLEALRNATKHAGVAWVDLDVRRGGDEFVVAVSDHGVGFDGVVPQGRGLAESFFARAARHGIRATLDTSPGKGTRLTLRYRLGDTAEVGDHLDVEPATAVVRGLRRRMCWTWGVVIVGSGLVTETVHRGGEFTLAHLMLLLVGCVCALCWLTCRHDRPLPGWLTALVIVVAPVAPVLALAAIEFGRSDAYLFQGAGTTPLSVVLLVNSRTYRPFAIAIALCAAAVLTVAARQPADIAMIAIAFSPALAIIVAWLILYAGFGYIGNRLRDDWERTVHLRFELVARRAGSVTRNRWNAAGLHESLQLLREIADGSADPTALDVRRRCREQERYLRQLISVASDGALMSWWFALALVEARARSVQLSLRATELPSLDPDMAEAFGRVVLACLATAVPESSLVVSLLEHEGAPTLFVVGPADVAPAGPAVPHLSDRCKVNRQIVGEQVLVEATWQT